MKIIRTFVDSNPGKMDEVVNACLAAGYELKKYGVEQTGPKNWNLVAILEKEVEEPAAEKAKQAFADIRDFCKSVPLDVCDGDHCPLRGWCSNFTDTVPEEWKFPTDEEATEA